MIPGIHGEVLVVAAYALFLVATAALLELMARHSHRRMDQYQTSGFLYFQKLDLWECPMGQPLARSELDYERRIVRYRAPARACNACSLKNNCTDSDEGRLLERRMDSWIQSEIQRFHRAFSLTLLLLAIVLLVAESFRHAEPRELILLGALLVPIGLAETRFLVSLRTRRAESLDRSSLTPAER